MCEGTRSLLSISMPADGWPRHTWIAWKIRGNLWASRGKSYIWVIDSIQYYCDCKFRKPPPMALAPCPIIYVPVEAESIEWFIEGHASLSPVGKSTGDTGEDWQRETSCWWERGAEGGGRSRIIRPQESLVLCKSFNTLCVVVIQAQTGTFTYRLTKSKTKYPNILDAVAPPPPAAVGCFSSCCFSCSCCCSCSCCPAAA